MTLQGQRPAGGKYSLKQDQTFLRTDIRAPAAETHAVLPTVLMGPAAIDNSRRRNHCLANQHRQFRSPGNRPSVGWFRGISELLCFVSIRQLVPFFQTRRTTESNFLSIPFTNVVSSQLFRTDLISHDRTFRIDHGDHGRFRGCGHRRHGCGRSFSFSAPRKKIHPTTNKQKTNTISHLRTPCWNVSERSTNAVNSCDSRLAIFIPA